MGEGEFKMKLAVIYDSKTNNTAAVAGYMAEE